MPQFTDLIMMQWNVNVVGVVFLTIALLPLIEKSSEKRVVNVASMLGEISYHEKAPQLMYSSYSATKAALTMATLKFHHEYVSSEN